MEEITKINSNGSELDEIVANLIGDRLDSLDQCIEQVKACFMSGQQILDGDLQKIMLLIPVYIYDVIEFSKQYIKNDKLEKIEFSKQMEMRKGLASEQATIAENEHLLNATGTVQEKKAKAENATTRDRFIEMAYKTATSIIMGKVEGAINILNSARKINSDRQKERYLTEISGNGVGSF